MSSASKTPAPHSAYVHGCPTRHNRTVHNGICKTKQCGRDENSCIAYKAWIESENKEKGMNNEA